MHSKRFLHGMIAKHANYCLGIDTNEEGIKELQRYGFNVLQGDVEEMSIGMKFDVVVAGDLIEHLSNPGNFLKCVRKHLKPQGILILHTPNPFSITRFWHALMKGYVEVNKDHKCYYDPITLSQLLEKHGFEVMGVIYTNTLKAPFFKRFVIEFFAKLRNLFYDSFLIIAKTKGVENYV